MKSLPESGDERLVRAVGDGDDAALGLLFDRHGRVAYSLALAILRDPHDAEDVVSAAFAQVWRQADRYDADSGSVGAWINVITRSRALDALRARGRRLRRAGEAIGDSPGQVDDTGESDYLHNERRDVVRRSLVELPEEQRQVIELAYWEGLTQSQIASRIDVPLGTVKTRIRSGMQRLRSYLQEQLGAVQ